MILMNLSAKEIITVCKANKDLSRACSDSRYNSLWIKKIKDDFGESVDQDTLYNVYIKNAYEEYKRLYILLKTPVYSLYINEYDEVRNRIFSTFNNAKKFLKQYFRDRLDKDTEQYIDVMEQINLIEMEDADDLYIWATEISINKIYLDEDLYVSSDEDESDN